MSDTPNIPAVEVSFVADSPHAVLLAERVAYRAGQRFALDLCMRKASDLFGNNTSISEMFDFVNAERERLDSEQMEDAK